jgi:ATP-binding cassette subfamily F protein 3
MILKFDNVNLTFGEKKIFENLDFVFNQGEKVAIIGENGIGKTSFFNLILKQTLTNAPFENGLGIDNSLIKIQKNKDITITNNNIGYLPQKEDLSKLTLESDKLIRLEKLMLKEEILADTDKYNKILEEYNNLSNQTVTQKEEELVKLFKFNKELYLKELNSTLSGGEITKFKLIKLIAQEHDYYLLDEPSNHLDIQTKRTLYKYLNDNIESYIIISHDVELLNKCCEKIIEIKDYKFNIYHGNYDYYIEEKQKETQNLIKLKSHNQNEINKLRRNIENIKQWSAKKLNEMTSHLKPGQATSNFGAGRGSADSGMNKSGEKVVKMRNKMDSIDIPNIQKEEEIKIKYFDFKIPFTNVVKINNLKKTYNTLNLNIETLTFENNEKIAIQGKNGSGKSTLLKLIIKEVKPDSGNITLAENIKIGYLSQKIETQDNNNTLLKELEELKLDLEEHDLRKYLGKFLFIKNQVFKKMNELSGGEKIRIELLKLIITGSNYLILDEPTNHLDITSKNVLGKALADFPGSILVVSHDNYFLDKFVTRKINIEEYNL